MGILRSVIGAALAAATIVRPGASVAGDYAVNEQAPPLSMPDPPTDPESIEVEEMLASIRATHTPFPQSVLPEDWTVDKVRSAIRLHDAGDFGATKRLIDAVTKDPRVMSALNQRTMCDVPLTVVAAEARNGKGVSATAAEEARAVFDDASICCSRSVRRRIKRDCIMAGVAVAQLVWTPSADGSRWNARVEYWPLEHVRWDTSINRYYVMTTEGRLVIEHGHGKWLIFEPHGPQSWMLGAVRSLGMPWADRTYGQRYRAQHAAAHGSPVPYATMPKGVATDKGQGKTIQRIVQALLSVRRAAVVPFETVIKYLEPVTQAWQVFDSIVRNSDSDITLSILGQNGTTQTAGVYTAPMFEGILWDIVENDAKTERVTLQTGLVNIWGTINFGVEFIPTIANDMPDTEAAALAKDNAERETRFTANVKARKDAGFVIDDDVIAAMAAAHGVTGPMPLATIAEWKAKNAAPIAEAAAAEQGQTKPAEPGDPNTAPPAPGGAPPADEDPESGEREAA